MGLFRNIERVFQDVLPFAAGLAPILIPGPGGVFAGAGLSILNSAIQNPVQRAGAAVVTARAQCPPMGTVGSAFGSPFQSAFFSSGGSLPGRGLGSGFVGRSVLGRPGVSTSQFVSQSRADPCGCPGQQVVTRFAQPIAPVKATFALGDPVFGPDPVQFSAGAQVATVRNRVLAGSGAQVATLRNRVSIAPQLSTQIATARNRIVGGSLGLTG